MAKVRRRKYDVFLGGDFICTELGMSEKEAQDNFWSCCGFDTLEEYCAYYGYVIDDLKVLPHVERGDE